MSLRAARALQPVWSQPQAKPISFEESLTMSKERLITILNELHLAAPKELDA
jgi:propane monooxygenase small subunit